MNRLHFIYCPWSGPNWIGEAIPRDADSVHEIPMAVPAVIWANKSAHVYGTGLGWEPGTRAARAELGKLLEALAVAAGGVAWDVCGQCCIVVPEYLAGDVAEAVDSAEPVMLGTMARTPEQRAYETEGPEYWAGRVRARNVTREPCSAAGLQHIGWSTTCETHDRAGDILADGTETPAIRYTRIPWHCPGSDPVEVGAPWEPAEMYPRPAEPAPVEAAEADTTCPDCRDSGCFCTRCGCEGARKPEVEVVLSGRYQGSREGRS